MKKVVIIGDSKTEIEPLVRELGFNVIKKNPDFVISYGGDGTLLKSEFVFPGVPKIILKNSHICKKCSEMTNEKILERIKQNKFAIKKYWKLEALVKNKIIYALNEIVIHNKNPQHCVRYKVFINNEELKGEMMGDGLIIATPFGSTAYYRSVTDSFFEVGMGLAFNNSIEQVDHVILKENRKIKIKISRGPAIVYADTQSDWINVNDGDEILIQKSFRVAKIITLN